jgi:hypothetical protein
MLIFLVGCFLLLFGVAFLATSYYDYLSAWLFMGWVMVVWFGAGIIVYLIEVFAPTFFDTSFIMRLATGIALSFVMFFLVSIVQVDLPLTARAIWDGPQFAEGVVAGKSSSPSRSGTSYYVTIEEVHYHVPDGAWWRTMEKGQQVEFAYANQIMFDIEAFATDKISLTPLGGTMIAAGLVLWLITLVVAVKGWGEIWEYFEGLWPGKVWPRPYPVIPLPEDYPTATNEEVPAFSLGSCFVVFGLFAFVAVLLSKVIRAKR